MEMGSNGKRVRDGDDDEEEEQVSDGTLKGTKKGRSLSSTLTDLDVFDCLICMEVLSPPVFQCQNGHIACSKCCTKVDNKCPACKMPNGNIRCLVLEKLLESMEVCCDYKEHGCKETFSYAEKIEHEATCVFAPCTCPVSDCKLPFPSAELPLHVSEHKFPTDVKHFRYKQPITIKVDKDDKYIAFQEGKIGHVFVLSHRVTHEEDIISFARLGSESDIKGGFKYELCSKMEQRSYRVLSSTECVRKRSELATVVDFLKIPLDFYTSGKLKLEVVIKN